MLRNSEAELIGYGVHVTEMQKSIRIIRLDAVNLDQNRPGDWNERTQT